MRLRFARPSLLVDIGRIPDLAGIATTGDTLQLGSGVTVAQLAASIRVHSVNPLWVDAAAVIADPSVRNLGTVGGNLAHADPLNDLPAALVAARGSVMVVGPNGERTIESDELFAGPFATTLRPGELITSVLIPTSPHGAYVKFKRAAVDYGVAAVAVQLQMSDGIIRQAGISVTGSHDVAPRAIIAEERIVGSSGSEADLVEAANAIPDSTITLSEDERGSIRYKRALLRVLGLRALRRAVGTNLEEHR
jgi:carbon-monoxide dehydrogenase medium subunit